MSGVSGAEASPRERNLQLLRLYHGTDDARVQKEALEELVSCNAPLVQSIASRFSERVASLSGVDMEDIVALGTMGLLRAIRSFDFSYETAFSTYAVPLIIGEIRRFLRDEGSIRVSRDVKKKAYALMGIREAFEQREGRVPTVGELAAESGESAERIAFYLGAVSTVSSLAAPMGGDDGPTLAEVLCDSEGDIDVLCENLSLARAVGALADEERRLIELRYRHGLSQAQTAAILGTSQVRVSRMEKRIFAKLREKL